MRIAIRLKPASARPEVGGEHDGALVVRVSARPIDGKATEPMAVAELRRALRLRRRVGHRPREAETLVALGNALSAQGLADAADDAWRQSLLVFSTFRRPAPLATAQHITSYDDLGYSISFGT